MKRQKLGDALIDSPVSEGMARTLDRLRADTPGSVEFEARRQFWIEFMAEFKAEQKAQRDTATRKGTLFDFAEELKRRAARKAKFKRTVAAEVRKLESQLKAAKRSKRRLVGRAIALGHEPPAEFRIFANGQNEAVDGQLAVWNETAAREVMAIYERNGIDLAIDLEHGALRGETDAQAWFKLEVRADGLWAINVRWTPEGDERLRAKKQRYISPLFATDESGVIRELVNCALTSYPATYDAEPLVAASRGPGR